MFKLDVEAPARKILPITISSPSSIFIPCMLRANVKEVGTRCFLSRERGCVRDTEPLQHVCTDNALHSLPPSTTTLSCPSMHKALLTLHDGIAPFGGHFCSTLHFHPVPSTHPFCCLRNHPGFGRPIQPTFSHRLHHACSTLQSLWIYAFFGVSFIEPTGLRPRIHRGSR